MMVEFKKTNERGNGRFWKMIDLPVAYYLP